MTMLVMAALQKGYWNMSKHAVQDTQLAPEGSEFDTQIKAHIDFGRQISKERYRDVVVVTK
jgi:hypothetical protein